MRRRSGRPRAGTSDPVSGEQTRSDSRPASSQADTPEALYDRTIAQALHTEEIVRTRGFSLVAIIMVTLVSVQLPWLPGDPVAKRVAGLAMVVMLATSLWAYLRARMPGGYTATVFRVHGWVLATGIVPVEYYVGFYSPMTVVLSLGIYYLGQSTDRRHSLWLPMYVTFCWIVGAALITAGVMEDRSVFSTRGLALTAQVFMALGVGGALLTTMWLARVARDSVRDAIVASNRALMVAQKREALLAEAHNQLDQAMRAAVGKPGRHTGEVAGGYKLDVVIGIGAMGEIYAAEQLESGEPAAVKLLHRDTLEREDMVMRFLREAEVCQRFEHPNLVKVRGVGRMADGAPFMVMERLQGETLAAVLRERGQLPLPELLALARALGAGLTHAHDGGVVHRDLKPHNLFLHGHDQGGHDQSGQDQSSKHSGRRWTILDFGISKLEDSTGTLTRESLVGTPAYMSPEQALGQPIDHRSDVFAMGSVLYRAMTGGPAFPGKETARIMFDVAYRMPKRPSDQARRVPEDVDMVFAIALAKAREQRFASAAAFATAFEAATNGKLDPATRARGRALVEECPWGAVRTADQPRD